MTVSLLFPVDSWVDLPRVYSTCTWDAFPFRAYPCFFRRPTTYLNDIPQEGYISPEALLACLAALPKFEFLRSEFKLATSHPGRIRPPPAISALTSFEFWGVGEYLEDLVSRIDCPRLNQIYIRYSRRPFGFQLAQLFQFIDRSEDPKLTRH